MTRNWNTIGMMSVVGVVVMALASTAGAAAPAAAPVDEYAPRLRPAEMEDIDGSKVEKQWPQNDVVQRVRPWVLPGDHRSDKVIENLRIHDVTNMKAIHVGMSSTDKPSGTKGEVSTFRSVTIRNCEISNVWRRGEGEAKGIHIDFMLINGGDVSNPFKPDLTIEDCFVHDGNAMPLLIKEGVFGTITLRRLRYENVEHSVIIEAKGTGHVDKVVVEQCAGLKVSLQGDPGCIGSCVLRNSPGSEAVNARDGRGITPATPISIEDAGAPVNRPTAGTTTAPATGPATTPVDLKDVERQLNEVQKQLDELDAHIKEIRDQKYEVRPATAPTK